MTASGTSSATLSRHLRARVRDAMGGDGFDPDLRLAAALLPRSAVTPLLLPVLRGLTGLVDRRPAPDVEQVPLAPGVGVRVYRPATSGTRRGPALLWIHGGGYLIGRAAQDDWLCRKFRDELGAVVASVEYRLAPEHPYPAPLEDCYRGLTWLANAADVDPDRIAIGGASAGGGLAAALALLARDRGEIAPCLQLLAYPMIDDRTCDRTDLDESRFRLWNRRSNRLGWTSYLGDADPDVAVPARRADLAGLAPAWIGVGTRDLFHDEDVAYAQRLTEAGVRCEIDTVPGAFHGFDEIRPAAGVSRAFFARQCTGLRDAFAR